MTNTLPGEWVELVKRQPGHDRTIDERVAELAKLPDRDQADVVRGVLFVLAEVAKGRADHDLEIIAAETLGYKAWRREDVEWATIRAAVETLPGMGRVGR